MTPLRKRMIEDMQLRNLAPETQRGYLHHIAGLARFFQTSPDNDCRYSAQSVNQFGGPLRHGRPAAPPHS